ncbi:MAG: hypothetical protein DI635_13010 [Pseudoxanthomonas suwonensis]|nr:MAG: hypothetical protein DI635_13010 [Pseudoxanthomonas suwonensis]
MQPFSIGVLAAALALATAPATAGEAIGRISDDIAITANQTAGALSTVSGDIHLQAKAHSRSLTTVSGDVRLADGAVAGNATTVSGDVDGGQGVQLKDVETVSGDVELGHQARTGAITTVSGDVRVGTDSHLAAVQTVSGDVFVDRRGQVARGIDTVSGAVGLVGSRVGGDVVTVTGNVTVGVGSHVRGGMRVRKPNQTSGGSMINIGLKPVPPRIVIGPQAVVDGALVFEHPVKLYVHRTARTGAIHGATAIAFDTPTPPRDP